MSLLICKKHGSTGAMPYVSEKIRNYILNEDEIVLSAIKCIHVNFYDESELLLDRYYYFDTDLFHQLSLSTKYEIVSDEDEMMFNNLINRHLCVVCIECFKEYMENIGYEYKL